MNAILIGLNTIAAILGYNRLGYYDFNHQDLINIANYTNHEVIIVDGETTLSNEVRSYDLYTVEGENRYICIEFTDSYAIYDKKDDTVDEFSYTLSPYIGNEEAFCVYVEDSRYIKYGIVDEHSIYNLQKNTYLDDIFSITAIDSNTEAGQYLPFDDYGKNVKRITNSYYFENLNDRHGENEKGTCAIVAIQMLLGYYDTFTNDHIIPENYDIVTKEYKTQLATFVQSPGTNNDFHNELIRFANEKNITKDGIGMDSGQEKNLTVQYLQSRNINFTYKWVEGNWSDTSNNSCSKHIKEAINADRPVFVGAAGHATVAFAYDENYVYVHSGWGDIRRTPWATFDTDFWDFWGGPHTVDITGFSTEHYHSDNYFSRTLNQYICPCGFHNDSLVVTPSDYGFESQYFFYEKSLNLTVGNYTFNTKRLRTGYIEAEKINLSPRRENAGTAYLEYRFSDAYLRKINVDLSLWSASENLYTSESTLLLQYLNPSNNVWVTAIDLLNDVDLGTDRYKQDNYTVEFPNMTKAFRFYSTSGAIGDRNKGRLSIGNMEIICHKM